VCAKGRPPGRKPSSTLDAAIRSLNDKTILDFCKEASAVTSEFRERVSPIPGTLGAKYFLDLRPGRWKWSTVYFNEPVSLRRGCAECLGRWCDAFPGHLKAFAAELCEMGHDIQSVKRELEAVCLVVRNIESRNWLACVCGDGNPADPDWRAPGWLLDWPDELENDAIVSAASNGRLGDDQTKDVCKAIKDAVSAELALAKEEALNHARILIAKEKNRTQRESEESLEEDALGSVSRPVGRGRFCDQVLDEIKKIKNLVASTGRSVAEIEKEHPNFAIWKVRTTLGREDQETFNHPNQWGAPVGYGKMVLSKSQNVAVDTITSWVKAYRKHQQTTKA